MSSQEVPITREELEVKREEKKRLKRRRRVLFLVYLVAALLLVICSAYYTYVTRLPLAGPQTGIKDQGRFNVLLLGVDEREHIGRADTIMLASIDPKKGEVGVISIPRDTRVTIPGRESKDRINSAHAYGGPELVVSTIEGLLGIPIHHYVKVSFAGFQRLVDALGGVRINVEKDMFYDDNAQDLHIRLRAGEQVLNGEQALGYVRFRSDGLGDVALVDPVNETYAGRVERQQKFVKALAAKMLSPGIVVKLPAMVRELVGAVETDMPLTKAVQLAYFLRQLDANSVKTSLIPGTSGRINGASYWIPDESGVRRVVDQLARGKHIISVEVLNGSGEGGIASRAAEYLKNRGLNVIKIGNADHFNYRETRVLAHKDMEAGESVAELIGKPVLLMDEAVSKADVTVIIGRDFNI